MTSSTAAPLDLPALAQALTDMADVFGGGMTAHHVGPHLNCTEAETIAHVLRLAGHADAAETFLDGHATGDDDADDDPEHIARAQRQEAASAAWWDDYTGESAARRILSDAGLTAPGMQVNRTTDGRGTLNLYAMPMRGLDEAPAVRLARAVELLAARGWTITDGPSAGMRTAKKPDA